MEKKAKKPAAKKIVKRKTSSAAKKTTTRKIATRKTATRKTATKKSAPRKAAPKKVITKTIAADLSDPTLQVLQKCFKALDDKKADNLKVLDVRGKSPITNYFIIATATSDPHMRALAGELEKTLKDMGVKTVGREYNTGSGWVVVDGFDFMAHIFLPEQRGMYGIESLWKDADLVSF